MNFVSSIGSNFVSQFYDHKYGSAFLIIDLSHSQVQYVSKGLSFGVNYRLFW